MALTPVSAAASPYAAPPPDPAQAKPPTERPRPEAARPPSEAPEPEPDPRAVRSSASQDLTPQAAAAQVAYQFQTLQNPATRAADQQNAQAQRARVNMVI